MKTSISIHSKLTVLILTFLLSFSACTQKTATENSSEVSKVSKPAQDIHEAIITNNLAVLKQHIQAGSDINKIEPMAGSSPLITAVTFNRPKMVAALLKANADLSIQNNDGSTALHSAAFFGRTEMVQLLLDAGADKTLRNNFGATPREIVLADFSQMKPVYEMLTMQLEPMGFSLDLIEVEKARPVVAMMLQ